MIHAYNMETTMIEKGLNYANSTVSVMFDFTDTIEEILEPKEEKKFQTSLNPE